VPFSLYDPPLPTVLCSGELLLDQGRFQDAIDKFDRAIELEKTKSVMNE
jgi:hypothetical protein